jgi:hypothetical protein
MEGLLVVDTDAMEWENGLDVVNHMAPEFGRNLGPAADVARVYVKYRQKTLRIDPKTTQRLDLIHLDPGYGDLTDAYHDSVEECLFLKGECDLSGEGHFVAGDYFWRPPGWIHSARTAPGFEALLMLEGVSDGDRSGPVSRRIRPANEAGTNALTADQEQAIGPRGWVRCLHTDLVAWQPGPAYARGQGRLENFDIDHAMFKVLSANPVTGAQSLLVRLSRGYRPKAAGRHAATVEFFVLEGHVQLGTQEAGKGSYVYRPAGLEEPPMTSDRGALLFMKTKGWLDYAAAKS